jgi:hypothetical protein
LLLLQKKKNIWLNRSEFRPTTATPRPVTTNQELLFVSSQLYEDWQYDFELPWNQSRSWEIHNSMNQWTMTEVTSSSEFISTQYSFPLSRIPINIIPHISKHIYVNLNVCNKRESLVDSWSVQRM